MVTSAVDAYKHKSLKSGKNMFCDSMWVLLWSVWHRTGRKKGEFGFEHKNLVTLRAMQYKQKRDTEWELYFII